MDPWQNMQLWDLSGNPVCLTIERDRTCSGDAAMVTRVRATFAGSSFAMLTVYMCRNGLKAPEELFKQRLVVLC
jgi:hypothetical protein